MSEVKMEKLAHNLFEAASVHAQIMLGEGVTPDDEAIQEASSAEVKIELVISYLKESL